MATCVAMRLRMIGRFGDETRRAGVRIPVEIAAMMRRRSWFEQNAPHAH
jgi:hypothetical protein